MSIDKLVKRVKKINSKIESLKTELVEKTSELQSQLNGVAEVNHQCKNSTSNGVDINFDNVEFTEVDINFDNVEFTDGHSSIYIARHQPSGRIGVVLSDCSDSDGDVRFMYNDETSSSEWMYSKLRELEFIAQISDID